MQKKAFYPSNELSELFSTVGCDGLWVLREEEVCPVELPSPFVGIAHLRWHCWLQRVEVDFNTRRGKGWSERSDVIKSWFFN